jgi:uncharacterized protein YkwD
LVNDLSPMKKSTVILSSVSALLLLAFLFLPTSAAQSAPPKNLPQANPPAPNDKRQGNPAPALPPKGFYAAYDLTEAPAGHALSELEFVERYCFDEVNRQRQAQNLAPLVFSQEILPVARQYSRRLAEENYFSHTDPEGRTTEKRAREAGVKFLLIGENLSQAKGYLDPVPDVVQHWMSSSGHRGNILNIEYQYAAVGVWIKDKTFFFTQIFLTR